MQVRSRVEADGAGHVTGSGPRRERSHNARADTRHTSPATPPPNISSPHTQLLSFATRTKMLPPPPSCSISSHLQIRHTTCTAQPMTFSQPSKSVKSMSLPQKPPHLLQTTLNLFLSVSQISHKCWIQNQPPPSPPNQLTFNNGSNQDQVALDHQPAFSSG